MKVVKINALWCSGCLVMNKVWNNILKKHPIETKDLDYDMDYLEVEKYAPGEILPVFIFLDDSSNEIKRIVGEVSEKKMNEILTEIGVI